MNKCMSCTCITDMYAQEPLKYMFVSMSFHGDAWSIDASVREVLQCHGCHQLFHAWSSWLVHACNSCIITKMSCDAMMDCAALSTWYETKQSCQKVAKVRHPNLTQLTWPVLVLCWCFGPMMYCENCIIVPFNQAQTAKQLFPKRFFPVRSGYLQ